MHIVILHVVEISSAEAGLSAIRDIVGQLRLTLRLYYRVSESVWREVIIVAEGALPHVKPYPEPMLAWTGAQRVARTAPGPHAHRRRTAVAPFSPPRAMRTSPCTVLALSGELYADALQRCGVSNFAVRANDYCLHTDGVDLKFGGNAQSISGKRWLHAPHCQRPLPR